MRRELVFLELLQRKHTPIWQHWRDQLIQLHHQNSQSLMAFSNNLTWLLLLQQQQQQQQQDDKQQEKRRTTTRKKSTNEKEQKKPIRGCSSSLESDSETSDDALNGGVEAKPGLFFFRSTLVRTA